MKFKSVMKKALATALAGTMVFSMAACGSKEKEGDAKGKDDGEVTLEFQQWWGVELPEGAL